MKCLICSNEINFNMLNILKEDSNICISCINSLEVKFHKELKKININNKEVTYELITIFKYNDFTKDYMYFLKEKGDIQLIKVMKPYLEDIYSENSEYVFLPIKSSKKTYEKRGFYPNVQFLKQIKGLKMIEGPVRLDNIKQGKLSKGERLEQKHKYKKVKLYYEKIIIFDDVIVTGHTLKCYIQNIDFVTLENLKVIVLLRGVTYDKMCIK